MNKDYMNLFIINEEYNITCDLCRKQEQSQKLVNKLQNNKTNRK